MERSADAILHVEGLHVEVAPRRRHGKAVQILRGVSLRVQRGTTTGLLGESGSGKSMTARAIMRQLPPRARVTAGQIAIDGHDLAGRSTAEMREIRGSQVGMIFQNPHRALHPMVSIERQMGEIAKAHRGVTGTAARELMCDYLDLCGIPDPRRVVRAYPHELSGGMAQRVVIATVLVPQPRLLIADEPTTGLDATIQRRVLDLLRDLQRRLELSVLLVTHDLGIVAHFCDRASVMRNGAIVEEGTPVQVLNAPTDAYARALVANASVDRLFEPTVGSRA